MSQPQQGKSPKPKRKIIPPPPCPGCKRPLTPVDSAGDPYTCPWLCRHCSRGWWNAELDAAADYDPATRDFGSQTTTVLAAADQELADAIGTGI